MKHFGGWHSAWKASDHRAMCTGLKLLKLSERRVVMASYKYCAYVYTTDSAHKRVKIQTVKKYKNWRCDGKESCSDSAVSRGGEWDFCTTKLYNTVAKQCTFRTMQPLSFMHDIYSRRSQVQETLAIITESQEGVWCFRLSAIRYQTPVVQRIKYFKYCLERCLCFLS